MIYLLLLLATVPLATGSECCKGYYNVLNDWVEPQFCDNYCCGSTLLGLSCCDSLVLQAPSYDRNDYCSLWWKNNVWAPILLTIGLIAMCVGCCVCCYKCCCSSNRTTVIVPNQGMAAPQISTTMVSASTHVH